MLILLTQSQFSIHAAFHRVTLSTGHLDIETLRSARNHGIHILEPLNDSEYVAWFSPSMCSPVSNSLPLASRSSLPQLSDSFACRLPGSINPIIRNEDSALSPFFPGPEAFDRSSLTGRFILWFLTGDDFPDPLVALREINAEIIHQSQLNYGEFIHYRVIGVALRGVERERIQSWDTLRCIAFENGTPVLDDEMAVLEVISGLDSATSNLRLYPELRRIGVNGDRTRIGIIDSGCDTNDPQHIHEDLMNQVSHYIHYTGSPGFDYVGHGTFIAGILAGTGALGRYDSSDSSGYNLGLGCAPGASLAISDALLASPFPPAVGYAGMIRDIALTGAHICNNSWTDGEGTGIGYHPNCAVWDAAIRHAAPESEYASSWPITCVFSAGNRGPQPCSISSPKEAKNIIVVGATGSIRSGSPDQPLETSSRGPCLDGRIAPLICAPGESVFSCWPKNEHLSQTGTSVAAACVTGLAVLFTENWRCRTGHYPSPAMVKGMLVLASRPVANSIPDPATGWGRVDGSLFDPSFRSATASDQKKLFETSGEIITYTIACSPDSLELDIVLAWTDPPAAPGAQPALVNDLDLLAETDQHRYSGNAFNDRYSVPDTPPDRLNNLERIRLLNPPPMVSVSIQAHAIRGDGVPGNGIPADQDFALILNGGFIVSQNPIIHVDELQASGTDAIDVLVTSQQHTGQNSFPIQITSTADPVGIITRLSPLQPSNTGVFSGRFFTGTSGRADEIQVHNSDMLSLKPLSGTSPTETTILINARQPVVQRIEVVRIFARETDVKIGCDKPVTLTIHYRIQGTEKWTSRVSDRIQNEHTIRIDHLEPRTAYEFYCTVIDTQGNASSSRDYLAMLRWTTNHSRIVFNRFMNSDPGFEILDGLWEWGEPSGLGIPPDPLSGATGDAVLGYNLRGNYENHLNPAHAVSPIIDCSQQGNYLLHYYRWLGTESGVIDQAVVSVRDSLGDWHNVWENPFFDTLDRHWTQQVIDVSTYAGGNGYFQFRFTQGWTDGGFARCGWNIDDILIEHQPFAGPTPQPITVPSSLSIGWDIDRYVFSSKDEFRLGARIFVTDATDDLAIRVGVSEWNRPDQPVYYFPFWTPIDDWIPVKHPVAGFASVHIVDFCVPDPLSSRIIVQFTAQLFDPAFPETTVSAPLLVICFTPDSPATN
ncbi:S8 family serine peptidase [bacterium]|nr:S8 family serine peptidase [candidate division CSSED10-310 bacterium]